MLPSSVSYPSILPLVAHIERTKEELLDRNCDSPLPVYNDPPTRVKKAKKTSSTASSNNSKPSSDKSSATKDSGVVLEVRVEVLPNTTLLEINKVTTKYYTKLDSTPSL